MLCERHRTGEAPRCSWLAVKRPKTAKTLGGSERSGPHSFSRNRWSGDGAKTEERVGARPSVHIDPRNPGESSQERLFIISGAACRRVLTHGVCCMKFGPTSGAMIGDASPSRSPKNLGFVRFSGKCWRFRRPIRQGPTSEWVSPASEVSHGRLHRRCIGSFLRLRGF